MQITLNKLFAANAPVDEFDVRQIKGALNRLGYYVPFDQVGMTGMPDAAMVEALKQFQADQGLSIDGRMRPDGETITALNTALASAPDGQYIWRTVGDDKVRGDHAALNGAIRKWSDSPDPAEEYNCRCWGGGV